MGRSQQSDGALTQRGSPPWPYLLLVGLAPGLSEEEELGEEEGREVRAGFAPPIHQLEVSFEQQLSVLRGQHLLAPLRGELRQQALKGRANALSATGLAAGGRVGLCLSPY